MAAGQGEGQEGACLANSSSPFHSQPGRQEVRDFPEPCSSSANLPTSFLTLFSPPHPETPTSTFLHELPV